MCTIRPSWLDAEYSQTSTFTSKLKYGHQIYGNGKSNVIFTGAKIKLKYDCHLCCPGRL
jgi:hypothetical protein